MKKPKRSPDRSGTGSLLSCLRSHLTQDLIDEVSRKGFAHLDGYGVLIPQDFKRLSRDHPGWQKKIGVDVTLPDDFLVPDPPDSVHTAQVIQFPLWQEEVRGAPNSILRSALFGVIKKGRRRYLEREIIASTKGIMIRFTGPRLDQADMDVWEQCLHLARDERIKSKIFFSAHGFLRALGRQTGRSQHEWLKGALARLSSATVEIQEGSRAYFGPLLLKGVRDDETGMYVVELNSDIAKLYGNNTWTQIDWEQRKSLTGRPLAQWLHGFYSTHAKPFPYKVETIKELCGSETKDLWKFRQSLKDAIQEVSKVTLWRMYIDENDCLVVVRPEKSLKN